MDDEIEVIIVDEQSPCSRYAMCWLERKIYEQLELSIRRCQTRLVSKLFALGVPSFGTTTMIRDAYPDLDHNCIDWYPVSEDLYQTLRTCGYLVLNNEYGFWWGSNLDTSFMDTNDEETIDKDLLDIASCVVEQRCYEHEMDAIYQDLLFDRL